LAAVSIWLPAIVGFWIRLRPQTRNWRLGHDDIFQIRGLSK
jgi:hypothetical protein